MLVRRRNIVLVVGFAIRGVLAMKTGTIPGGCALFAVLLDIPPYLVGLAKHLIVLVTDTAVSFETWCHPGYGDQGRIQSSVILADRIAIRLIGGLFALGQGAGDRAEVKAAVIGGFGVDLGFSDAGPVFTDLGDAAR